MAHEIYADKFTKHDWQGDRTTGPDGMADEASETHTDFSGWRRFDIDEIATTGSDRTRP